MGEDIFLGKDLDLEDADQGTHDAPKSVSEVYKRSEKAEAGKIESTSFSLPENLVKRLRAEVFTQKAQGKKITMSQVVAKALDVHLKKLERKQAKAGTGG